MSDDESDVEFPSNDDWKGNDDDDKDEEENSQSSDEEYDEIIKNDETEMSWKDGLAQKARNAFLERQSNTKNLMKIVYGIFQERKKQSEIKNDDVQGSDDDDNDDDDDDKLGGLFKIASAKQKALQNEKQHRDIEENCFFNDLNAERIDWTESQNHERIRNCFVTGKWKKSEDAEELLRLDDMSDADSEIYGDFEDLESGQKHAAQKPSSKVIEEVNISDQNNEAQSDDDLNSRKRKMTRVEEENLTKRELMAKKIKLKEKFDASYDNGDKDGRITGDHQYYEALKAEASRQSEINKKEFAVLDESTRIDIEGYRAGLYVRMKFTNMPCEFVENFDASCPLLIGGLNMAEENIGFVSCKIKKHRWYKKILKTQDPLVISLGWRRFQTIPIYSKMEDNLKMRYLKYTPNHVTCNMTFFGPITPQNTGFLAIQSVAQEPNEMKRIGFRIAATGAVTETDKSTQIMKKLKLIGTPFKIYKKTAFIKGMFTSELEVAKFEGAKIKTVSGIRGQIKKSEREPKGAFRATFEDQILLSDIVFCRTWFRVDVPRFYTPVTSLLLPLDSKSQWQGMKTLGQLKREKQIKAMPNTDSLYTEIKREEKQFRPLTIPKALQKSLPYKLKPKLGVRNPTKSIESERVAVIRSPHEQKVSKMMNMLKMNFDHRQEKQKQLHSKQVDKFRKQKQGEELRKLKRQKELKKKVFRTLSKLDKAKEAEAQGGRKRKR